MENIFNNKTEIVYLYFSCGDGGPLVIKYKKTDGELKEFEDDVNYDDNKKLYKEEIEICLRLTELTSLETFVFDSCSGICIPAVPSSLKHLKLSHAYFNSDLFEKMPIDGSIYVTTCCHYDSDFRVVHDIEDARKRTAVGDSENCTYCNEYRNRPENN